MRMVVIEETVRALIVGVILWTLIRKPNKSDLSRIAGWRLLTSGFALIFFGSLIDITDNFESLNRFVFIGDTHVEAFLEKVVGYLAGYILVALGILRWLPKDTEHNKMVEKRLEEANKKVNFLSGFIPICASCKNIRNDKGYWTEIETYISEHSAAEFTHGICPDCTEKLYPEYSKELKEMGNLS